ncbi:MAG TPA: hypothetical protein VMU01_11090, partial [Rhizomicrobium sp.]|nr:hypothetical protein [Rhizomicrobium sp.]
MSKSTPVGSWEEFVGRIAKLRAAQKADVRLSNQLLFRGHSNAAWTLQSTLDRVHPQKMRFSDYYRTIALVQCEIESLTANRWAIPDYDKLRGMASKYDFLHLQP